MASMYDSYWQGKVQDIKRLLAEAYANGTSSQLDVSGIQSYGQRDKWYGAVDVFRDHIEKGEMAHARSLGNVIVSTGLLAPYMCPGFRMVISNKLTLVAKRLDGTGNPVSISPAPPVPGAAPVAAPAPAPRPRSPLQGGAAVTPEEACRAIHDALVAKPRRTSPAQVAFKDGLYFFYEEGEVSEHGPKGRIVRVGNHLRIQGGLVRRLKLHYSGNKNSSVFRKFLGGALLRRANPSDPCLSPGPGKGHWEKQDEKTCPHCHPTEAQVSGLLRQRFSFRCVFIPDMAQRNDLEALLVATLAACEVCHPSPSWLGQYAYSEKVRASGLWNSQYVGDPTIDQPTLDRFLKLVAASP